VDISRKLMTMLRLPPVKMMVMVIMMMFFVRTTTTTTTLAFTPYYSVPIIITKRSSTTLPTRRPPRATTTTVHFMSLPNQHSHGRTIQQDGWDGLRSMIWWLFQCTEYIFPILGGLLTCGLILNLMGYGYYFDTTTAILSTDDATTTTTTRLVIDTLEHIRQQNQLLSYSISSISNHVPPVVVVAKDIF
jgi:hypothetical protein